MIIYCSEEVIEALLKDAKKFKSKRELNTNEAQRSKPNVNFLARTLRSVVKTNKHLMRNPKLIAECEEHRKTENEAKCAKGNEKYEENVYTKRGQSPRKSSTYSKSRSNSTFKSDKDNQSLSKPIRKKK